MSKIIIKTDKAPKAIGPYSQAVAKGGTLYVSGQVPVDPATGKMPEAFEDQVRQTLANITAALEAGGATLDDVVKVGVFVTDLGKFPILNELYAKVFTGDCPARSTVQVAALPLGAQVEMDVIAVL